MGRVFFGIALTVFVGLPTVAQAQADADPNRDYAITPEAGPWLIKAAVYVGPRAPSLAHEMALEIRSRFKMPAYVLNRGDEERRKQEAERKQITDQYDALNKMLRENHQPEERIPPRLLPRIQEQCAVLVGGYRDMEAANRALKEFKKLPPPSKSELCPIHTQESTETSNDGKPKFGYAAYGNPFVDAFVVPNPTIPRERKSDDRTNDPFLKKLNAHEQYSLLRCKKPYTLLVAAFQGLNSFEYAKADDKGFFEKLWAGNTGERLDASGQNAHNLADVLRKLDFEAYVLHMREGSAVTIGAFDREDDPKIKSIEGLLLSRFKYGQGVQLLPQPLVMRVPHP
jgi:hypothetical protein